VSICLSKWAIRAIDKLRRAFLWSGSAVAVPGRCKVAWARRADPSKVWASLPISTERVVLDLFRASTEVFLGDGSTALFWVDSWLDGMAIETIAPNLLRAVPPRFRSRSVKEGLAHRTWIKDIRGTLTEIMVVEYVEVWERVRFVTLTEGVQDSFRWRWEPDGAYSSSSAYRACFLGSTVFLGAKFIWKAKVPPKVKFFAWLAAHDRCWTDERRHRHGLQYNDLCALCDQEAESINHLLLQCSFSREVWFLVFQLLSWQVLTPGSDDQFLDWWASTRSRVDGSLRKGFDAVGRLDDLEREKR
ncbi:hypothetical protein U9M48_032307, partial [Paspalum notatum var. saurae]